MNGPMYTNPRTPIIMAICNNNLEVVKRLIGKKTTVPQDALWYFFRRYKETKMEVLLPMIKLLRKNGALINLQEDQSQPISEAIMNYNIELVEYLLKNGADPNGGGRSQKHISHAASNNFEKIIVLLLEYGATPTENALRYSCDNCNINSIEQLLIAGINPNIEYSNPLCIIVEHCRKEYKPSEQKKCLNIIELLLQYGADPTMNEIGLHLKCSRNAIDLMRTLNSKGEPLWGNLNDPQDLRNDILLLLEKNCSEWWKPYNLQISHTTLQMLNFKTHQRRNYGACCAVLLCAERLDSEEHEGLPIELWELILSCVKNRELGYPTNTRKYNLLKLKEKSNNSSPKITEISSNSSPKITEISSNSSPKISSNNNNWEMVGKNNLQSGGVKSVEKNEMILETAYKNLGMKDYKFSVEKEIGISEYELNKFIYLLIYMTPVGLMNNNTVLNMIEKITNYISKTRQTAENKSTKKSTKKLKNKSTRESTKKLKKKSTRESKKKYTKKSKNKSTGESSRK